MPANSPPIGPHSSRLRLRKVDGRTGPGRYIRRVERELIEHCGGPDRISVAQRLLCERTAIDLLRLKLIDADLTTGEASDHILRVAHALRGTVRLALRDLGLEAAARPALSLDDIAAEITARRGAAA
jgi:hypothetical protein